MNAETAYLFRHAVVRDAAYGLQPPSERAALHGLALDVLEAVPGLNRRALGLELARHARLAHELGHHVDRFAAKEREYLFAGGDHARFNYDYAGALEAFERLHELQGDDPKARALTADALADTLQRLGRWHESQPLFEEIRHADVDPGYVGRALVHLAWMGIEAGKPVDDLIEEGEAIVEREDHHQLRISFMMVRAHQKAHSGDYAGAANEIQPVIEYADRTKDWVQKMIAHSNAAQYFGACDELEKARRHLDAAEDLCAAPTTRHHRAGLVQARAKFANRAGDYQAALAYAEECAKFGATTGSRGLEASAKVEAAVALAGLKRFIDGFDLLQDSRPLIAETGDANLAVSWLNAYGTLMQAWGKGAEAKQVLREGVSELAGRVPLASLDQLNGLLDEL